MTQLSMFLPRAAVGPGLPPLPERVPCISLWAPYAELVVYGEKTIETRTWPWPYAASWLVIHEAKHVDREAERRLELRIRAMRERHAAWPKAGRGVAATGLVYVAGCRPLLPADEEAACFYASDPPRFAWTLDHSHVFRRPVAMRGPQKFVYLPRETVLVALEGS